MCHDPYDGPSRQAIASHQWHTKNNERIAALEAEVKRLREALQRADEDLAKAGYDYDGDFQSHFNRTTHAHRRIQEALRGKELKP